MADANNRIRLQIVTELDAAGIKATKEQIDSLELGIRRAGNTSVESGEKFGAMEKALGKLPGSIGRIGGALGGLAGQATMAIGAFTTGFKIGEQLREWTVGVYEWASGITEAKEAAEAALKINEGLVKQGEDAVQRQIALAAKQAAMSAESIKGVDDQTAAYFRQAAALEGLKKSSGNAEVMQLERDKFEEMRGYAISGNAEAGEQIGRYYDVLIAEVKAKQEIEAFDRESLKLTKERESEELKAAKAIERTEAAKERLDKATEKLASIDRHENGARGGMYHKMRGIQLKEVEDAQKQYDKAVAQEDKIGLRLDEIDAKEVQRQMDRANLNAAGTMAVDRAAAAYDDYVAQNGNPLNAEIDPNWSADLLKQSQDAYNVQREMLEVCKAFGDRMEKLLELK